MLKNVRKENRNKKEFEKKIILYCYYTGTFFQYQDFKYNFINNKEKEINIYFLRFI
jgi:hypothetical protein